MTASVREDVVEAAKAVYARLQVAIDARKPRCDASGRCCRFEQFGHRLYVTTIELAAFVHDVREGGGAAWNGTGCPYQIDGLCSVHAARPFGCRVFFCDPTSGDWQHEQYERFHADLKRLHEQLGVAYRYVEWRQALGELGLATVTPASAAPDGSPARLSLPQLPL